MGGLGRQSKRSHPKLKETANPPLWASLKPFLFVGLGHRRILDRTFFQFARIRPGTLSLTFAGVLMTRGPSGMAVAASFTNAQGSILGIFPFS
jgi:hypothetical protein